MNFLKKSDNAAGRNSLKKTPIRVFKIVLLGIPSKIIINGRDGENGNQTEK